MHSFARSWSVVATSSFLVLALAACSGKKDGDEDAGPVGVDCATAVDGTACESGSSTGICVDGACVATGCGNGFVEPGEVCDDGNETAGDGCDPNCTRACDSSAQCDDGGSCNGVETCDLANHVCVAGTPVSCSASDACHASSCDLATGSCVETLIDADGDGHSPESAGSCGDDCDDADPTSYPGATEICGDGKDNNCQAGTSDESQVTLYADCDRDGFAAASASPVMGCGDLGTDAATTGCPDDDGLWTDRAPTTMATTDCADGERDAHPVETPNEIDFQDAPIPGTSDWDWNCDGAEQQEVVIANGGQCLPGLGCAPTECCTFGPGTWVAGPDPACGDSAAFEFCGDDVSDGGLCPNDAPRQQRCR